jgi:hypothetical protein
MLEFAMNSPAAARPPSHRRVAMIVAGVSALLGSFMVTAPAQAGYYGEGYYGSRPCSYRCGGYGYEPYRYYHRCSSCGCYRRCYSTSRSGLVYERRYVEREFVERRYGYGWPSHHYYGRRYGYNPYGYGYNPYGAGYGGGYYERFPYGYGGVRGWRSPYGYRYPSAYRYADEGPPRPLAPIPYGYDGEQY